MSHTLNDDGELALTRGVPRGCDIVWKDRQGGRYHLGVVSLDRATFPLELEQPDAVRQRVPHDRGGGRFATVLTHVLDGRRTRLLTDWFGLHAGVDPGARSCQTGDAARPAVTEVLERTPPKPHLGQLDAPLEPVERNAEQWAPLRELLMPPHPNSPRRGANSLGRRGMLSDLSRRSRTTAIIRRCRFYP